MSRDTSIPTREHLQQRFKETNSLVADREQILRNRTKGGDHILQRGALLSVGVLKQVQNLQPINQTYLPFSMLVKPRTITTNFERVLAYCCTTPNTSPTTHVSDEGLVFKFHCFHSLRLHAAV